MNTSEKIEEEKLTELREMMIGCWIHRTISFNKWREYKGRNEGEWIKREGLNTLLRKGTFEEMVEREGLNTLLRGEIFERMVEKRRDPLEWFVTSSSVSSSEVQCSLVRLIESTTDRTELVEEDADRHRVVCRLLERVFKEIETPSQILIDSTVHYLVKIIHSRHWISITRVQKIPLGKWLDRLKLSGELGVKLDDALEKIKETSKEEKLEELKEMAIGRLIDDTISEDEWEEYWERNDVEWIKREGLNSLLREEIFEEMLEKGKDPFEWFVSSTSVSSSEVQCSLVRLIERTTHRTELVKEDADRHRVVCGLLERVFQIIENPSQALIDLTVHYVAKIFHSQALRICLIINEKNVLGGGQRM